MSMDKLKAYESAQKGAAASSARETEAQAFMKAAELMENAKRAPEDDEKFNEALRFNHLLWTIIQADLTEPANELPNQLKANIMSLSLFVDKQVSTALAEGNRAILDGLIEINRNLAVGLRSGPDTDQETEQAPQRPPDAI